MEKVFAFVDKYKKWIYLLLSLLFICWYIFPISESILYVGKKFPYFINKISSCFAYQNDISSLKIEEKMRLNEGIIFSVFLVLGLISCIYTNICAFRNKKSTMLIPLLFFSISVMLSVGYDPKTDAYRYFVTENFTFFIICFCINFIYFVLRKAYVPITQAIKARKENRKPTKDERIAELERRVAELEKKEN